MKETGVSGWIISREMYLSVSKFLDKHRHTTFCLHVDQFGDTKEERGRCEGGGTFKESYIFQ